MKRFLAGQGGAGKIGLATRSIPVRATAVAVAAGLGWMLGASVAGAQPIGTAGQVAANRVSTPAQATRATVVQPELAQRTLLLPNGEATLGSQRLGRVLSVPLSMGTAFARGQVLVELDCSEPKAQTEVLKVELAGAVETYEAKLFLKGLEQASDIEVVLAASAVQKAKAQINVLRMHLDQCTITAPWAGRVVKVHTRSFSTVSPGDPLLDVVRAGPLKVRMNLPSSMSGQVRAQSAFVLKVDETGQEYPGKIVHINARVDPVSQILEVEGVMAKTFPDLLPGMSGVARLSSPVGAGR